MHYLCSRIARSSNGRTADFGSACVGSNPARATIKNLRFLKTKKSLHVRDFYFFYGTVMAYAAAAPGDCVLLAVVHLQTFLGCGRECL